MALQTIERAPEVAASNVASLVEQDFERRGRALTVVVAVEALTQSTSFDPYDGIALWIVGACRPAKKVHAQRDLS
jgi:hypothetical protein